MGRGRPRKIEPETIVEVILQHKEQVLLPSNAIVPKHDEVWKVLSQKLGDTILPSSLYTFATCNTYGVRDKLTNRSRQSTDFNDSLTRSESELGVSNFSVTSTDEDIKTLQFFIFFDKAEFDNLLITKTYKRTVKGQPKVYDRTCTVLDPGTWEEVFSEKIYDASRLECGFNFKNHRIANDGTSGTINGNCNCGSVLLCEIVHSKNDVDIRLKCTVKKGDGICGKRYLRQPTRRAIAAELQGKAVSVYRAEKAKDLMRPGDPEPPNLRSANVLRAAKCEYISATHLDLNPVIALAKMQLSSHKNMIHLVALNPFSSYYWSNHQLHVFREYAKSQPACIFIDATGSIVKKVLRCDNKTKSKHVFLYECVVHWDGRGQFSVAQMLTENHKTTSIQAWLNEWLNTGVPCPKEVVCDSSKALLTASIRTFTPYSTIDEYAEAFSESGVPSCWIRIDVAHFTKMYASFLKGVNRRVRRLFLASLGQLILSRSIEEAKSLLKSILIVALSETEGTLTNGQYTPCEEHKERLAMIVTENDFLDLENGTENGEYEDIDENTRNNSKWLLLGRNIFESVQILVSEGEGNRVNAHYLPQLAERLIKDMRWLPLWSCIFRDTYGYGRIPASSASVEGDFNQIKNRLLKSITTPMRVDDFVQKHLDYLNGRIKIVEANAPSLVTDSIPISEDPLPLQAECEKISVSDTITDPIEAIPIPASPSYSGCPACNVGHVPDGTYTCAACRKPVHIFESCSIIYDEDVEDCGKRVCISCQKSPDLRSTLASQEIENWGGLAASDNKKRKKDSEYLQKNFRKNEFILHPKLKKIPIIRNGNDPTLQAIKIGGKLISVENTCSLDSFFQIFLTGAHDSPVLKETLANGAKTNLFFRLVEYVREKGLTSHAYRLRTQFLISMFPKSRITQAGNHIIPCQVTVADLSPVLFKTSSAMQEITKCDKGCAPRVKEFSHFQILHFELLDPNFETYVQREKVLSPQKCCTNGCLGTETTVITEVGNFVTFEVYSADFKTDINSIVLGLIPKTVRLPLQDDVYRLIGIVHFKPPAGLNVIKTRTSSFAPKEIGHYSAICHRRDGTWVLYDGLYNIERTMEADDVVTPHILVYARY